RTLSPPSPRRTTTGPSTQPVAPGGAEPAVHRGPLDSACLVIQARRPDGGLAGDACELYRGTSNRGPVALGFATRILIAPQPIESRIALATSARPRYTEVPRRGTRESPEEGPPWRPCTR